MGFKITKDLEDKAGYTSNEVYVNIGNKFLYIKDKEKITIYPCVWKSKTDRDNGKDQIFVGGINNSYQFDMTTEHLEQYYAYDAIYAALKAQVKADLELADNEVVDV